MIAELTPSAAVSPYASELALVSERMKSEAWAKIEQIEAQMRTDVAVNDAFRLNHIFTPGLYVREIFMPKGMLLTSRIHLTEHPFVISCGVASIWDDEKGWVTMSAPHTGITKPGTRRILYIHEDTIFSTFHLNPENETDPDRIILEITYSEGKFATIGAAAAYPSTQISQ